MARRVPRDIDRFLRWFLLPGETLESAFYSEEMERRIREDGELSRGAGPNEDGARIAFLKHRETCSCCGERGPAILATGRDQIRIRNEGRISWLCRDCGLRSGNAEIRRLAGLVRAPSSRYQRRRRCPRCPARPRRRP